MADEPEGADLESLQAHAKGVQARYDENNCFDDMLDGVVHDVASQIGSRVNNEGLEAQVAFLAEHVGIEAAGYMIDQAVEGESDATSEPGESPTAS